MALPTASDNPFPSVLVTETAAASIGSPASGKQRLFVDTDHVLKYKNSSGTVSNVGGGGSGGVATDPIWDAAGDIVVGTGADTAARLAAGTNGRVLELVGGTPVWRGPKIYLNKPAGNITRAATTVGAFSTAWQIPSVVVAAGQNVRLTMSAAQSVSVANNDVLFALFRDSTQIAAGIFTSTRSDMSVKHLSWIDENPGAATYTYEVRAAMFTAGTLTVYQTNITTDTNGGTSIFIAEVYTP